MSGVRFIIMLLLFLPLGSLHLGAQTSLSEVSVTTAAQPMLLLTKASDNPISLLPPDQLPAYSTLTEPGAIPSLQAILRPSLLNNYKQAVNPLGYCADDLAFFCRLEVKLEKATIMPVRFRLGSTQYVDYLEGKFEGWRYGY